MVMLHMGLDEHVATINFTFFRTTLMPIAQIMIIQFLGTLLLKYHNLTSLLPSASF